MNEKECQNELSNEEKHILHIFCLQGPVKPYQEDLKPPAQYYDVTENQTDFLQESWTRDRIFEDDYIKDWFLSKLPMAHP